MAQNKFNIHIIPCQKIPLTFFIRLSVSAMSTKSLTPAGRTDNVILAPFSCHLVFSLTQDFLPKIILHYSQSNLFDVKIN